MQIKIDPTSDVPRYMQLQSELEYFVVTGVIPPGSRLPSVRELGAQTGLSTMTVMKALERLRQKGIVRIEPGLGIFAIDANDGDDSELRRNMTAVVQTALERGASREAIVRAFMQSLGLETTNGNDCVALIGPKNGGLRVRAQRLKEALADLGAQVVAVELEDLEANPEATLRRLGPVNVFATLLFDIAAVRRLLTPHRRTVVPLLGRVQEDVQEQVAALPAGARLVIAASSREFLTGMMVAVEEFRALDQRPICASTEDMAAVKRAIQSADAVVYGSLARDRVLSVLPAGMPAIELLYDIDPSSIDRIRNLLERTPEAEPVIGRS